MCIFRGQKSVAEKGLLTLEQFPLPLPDEELGGDVIIGWREWGILPQGQLHSPTMGSSYVWDPQKPFSAGGKPSANTGRGIYCFDDRQENERWGSYLAGTKKRYAAGRVALFGAALNFDGTFPPRVSLRGWKGAMGEYAYPLDLHVRTIENADLLLSTWGKMGVNIWLENTLGNPVLYKSL